MQNISKAEGKVVSNGDLGEPLANDVDEANLSDDYGVEQEEGHLKKRKD